MAGIKNTFPDARAMINKSIQANAMKNRIMEAEAASFKDYVLDTYAVDIDANITLITAKMEAVASYGGCWFHYILKAPRPGILRDEMEIISECIQELLREKDFSVRTDFVFGDPDKNTLDIDGYYSVLDIAF